MAYVITVVLREKKPLAYLTSAFIVMAASQVVLFLANDPLCKASQQKVDGSFIATLLETISVVLLIVTWSSVTEGEHPSPFPQQNTDHPIPSQKHGAKKTTISDTFVSSFSFFPGNKSCASSTPCPKQDSFGFILRVKWYDPASRLQKTLPYLGLPALPRQYSKRPFT